MSLHPCIIAFCDGLYSETALSLNSELLIEMNKMGCLLRFLFPNFTISHCRYFRHRADVKAARGVDVRVDADDEVDSDAESVDDDEFDEFLGEYRSFHFFTKFFDINSQTIG